MALAFLRGRRPSRALTRAAAILMDTVASTKAGCARSPEMGKFSSARAVWAPHRALAGTRTSPIVSFSTRVLAPLRLGTIHPSPAPATAGSGAPSVSAHDEPDRRLEDGGCSRRAQAPAGRGARGPPR